MEENTLFRRRKQPRRRKMDSGEAWALLVLGILLGTVFVFGMSYWNQPITREEAIQVEAAFSGFREQAGHQQGRLTLGDSTIRTGSSSVAPVILEFRDHAQLTIDGSCVTDALLAQLQALKAGDTLTCIVHPHSDTVLEIAAGDELLMPFDSSVSQLHSEQKGFFWLGIIMYTGALYGLLNLIPWRRRR